MTRVKLFYLIVFLALGLTGAPVVRAAVPGDLNGDGCIDSAEFRNIAARQAAEADADGNGILDQNEFQLSGKEFKAIDTNKDGNIQISELQEHLMQAFERLDGGGKCVDSKKPRAK